MKLASGWQSEFRQKIVRWIEQVARAIMDGIAVLKRHRNPWVRRGLAVLLILGGLLWFLPVLGLWMLPVGFVLLSDESHRLRRLRRRLQVWFVTRVWRSFTRLWVVA